MRTGIFLRRTGSVLAFGLLALAGCTAGAGGGNAARPPTNAPAGTVPGAANRYKVTVETSPFYKLGPQQPGGPDLGLKQGTRLVLLRRAFGFSQVQLGDGQTGFVGTGDLAPLSAEEIAAEQQPPPGALAAATPPPKKGRRGRLPRTGPMPIVAEPGLPSAEAPARSGPTPAFRY